MLKRSIQVLQVLFGVKALSFAKKHVLFAESLSACWCV